MSIARPSLILLVAAAVFGGAASTRGANISPQAKELLGAVAKAYKALPSYSDEGKITLRTLVAPGKPPVEQTVAARVAVERPNKVNIDAGLVKIVSDGKVLRTIVPPLTMYRDQPAPATLTLDQIADGPLGALQYSGPQGRPLAIVLGFLLADDPVKGLLSDAAAITVVDGGKTLKYEPQVGSVLQLHINPENKLITRIDVRVDAKSGEHLVPSSGLEVQSLAWTAGTISTKPAVKTAFDLIKPDGYKEIAALAKDVAKKKAEHELIGKPAPELSLNILEAAGKTRKVTTKDLVGKVVMIDFWATWCGPCLVELPDVAAMIGDYAKANKPVVVVALSIDQSEDGDQAELRKIVEATMEKKGLKLQVPPVGIVGLDPAQIVAKAYDVQAIPQLVIIDAKGIVRHVHIGVTERDVLAGEVDALIAEAAKASK